MAAADASFELEQAGEDLSADRKDLVEKSYDKVDLGDLEGMDTLVLRGSEQEVQQLMDVVGQIEDQSRFAESQDAGIAGLAYNRHGFVGGGGFASSTRRLRLPGAISGKPLFFNRPWGVNQVDYSWFNNLFAPLPPPPAKPQEPKQPWPAEARGIARSLLRTEQLTGVKDGLKVEIRTESFDPRWDALTGRVADQGHRLPQRLVDGFQRRWLADLSLLGRRQRAGQPRRGHAPGSRADL